MRKSGFLRRELALPDNKWVKIGRITNLPRLALLQETEPEPAMVAATLHYLGQVMVASGEHRHTEARDCLRQALELATDHQLAPLALDASVDVAQLLAQATEIESAIELLALVAQHEASTFQTQMKARDRMVQLEAELPLERTQAAQDPEQMLDLWAAVQTLLSRLTTNAM